jgi:hypothetical protein
MANERATGPFGGQWEAEVLASIHEQLQQISYLLGQAHFTSETRKRGPIEQPEKYPRPHESFEAPRSAADVEEFDDSEWLPPTEDELIDVRIDPEESGGEDG